MRKKQYRVLVEHLENVEQLCRQIMDGLSVPDDEQTESGADEWIQKGLNSIMSFQAGKKKGAEE